MDTVSVRIIGLKWSCRHCGGWTRTVVGPCRGREIVTGDDALELSRAVLIQTGHEDVAGLLVQRYSGCGRPLGVASACSACGAVQQTSHVHTEVMNRLRNGDRATGLEMITEGSCALSEWDRLVDADNLGTGRLRF